MDYVCISEDVILEANVRLSKFINLYGCTIGENTKIGAFVEVQKKATIGKNCKISSHTFICEGVHIQDNVFIGHNVSFINDKYPKAVNKDGSMQADDDWQVIETSVEEGVCIGTSTTILCGVTIGRGAIIGAGSVITKDIPPHQIWAGNPAKMMRVLEDEGE